ncbi:MAG TPA: alpha/beta hydrolase [Anaerolineae bacterium]|nr:alpha/beta hydrolase [Anaerolineae bacterium]
MRGERFLGRSRDRGYWRNLGCFTVRVVVVVVLVGTVGFGVWMARSRAMALVHPGRSQPGCTPAERGVEQWEEVRFPSADNLQLGGWFIPPAPQTDGATLIFIHGLGGNRGELLDEAVMLSGHGYGALLFDLRNHGQSEGTATTLGYAEVADVRGAVAYLLARPEVNPEHIGVVGSSMGGAVAIRAAARIPEIRAVVAQSAFSSLDENVSQGVRALTGLPPLPLASLVIWFGEREAGIQLRQVRPIDDVGQIAPRAILFIHGEQDPVVDVSNSLRLYQAAREPKALYLVPNAGHGGLLAAAPAEFERRMVSFLDTHLRGRGR